MKPRYRMQEWAADRFDSVQYPRERDITPTSQPRPERLLSYSQMLGLFVIGSVSIVIGSLVLAFLAFFFFPALFSA